MEAVLLETFGRFQERVKDPVAAAILTVGALLQQTPKRTGLTIDEASEYLGVCPTTIRKLCKKGQLRKRQLGRAVRFNADDLDTVRRQSQPPVHPDSDLRHFR